MPRMSKSRPWRGVRMRDTEAAVDPGAPPRPLTLSAAWIGPIAARARARAAGDPALAERLHALLLRRRAAPTTSLWAGPL